MFIGTWWRCTGSPVPKSQKIIDLALSPAVILGRERVDAASTQMSQIIDQDLGQDELPDQ
jgi:hypothetical protein